MYIYIHIHAHIYIYIYIYIYHIYIIMHVISLHFLISTINSDFNSVAELKTKRITFYSDLVLT